MAQTSIAQPFGAGGAPLTQKRESLGQDALRFDLEGQGLPDRRLLDVVDFQGFPLSSARGPLSGGSGTCRNK